MKPILDEKPRPQADDKANATLLVRNGLIAAQRLHHQPATASLRHR
jgi:hypothetical protein